MNVDLIIASITLFDMLTVGVSLILLVLAYPICKGLNRDDGLETRVSMMRILNVLIIAAVLLNVVLQHQLDAITRLGQALIVIYFAVLLTQVINFGVRARFGKQRSFNDSYIYSDTYSSRGLSLVVAVVIAVVTIITCLRILGLNSLLEAGGALGIIGLFLVTTQASWAPDIISGLIILNSRLCEEGDVVQFNLDGALVTASIFKTKLFHTEFLDLANNHRFMVRNAKLRDHGLQNLSRFASSKGLRECLYFNIDYRHSSDEVTAMIMRAFEQIDQAESSRVEHSDPQVMVYETGDFAVTWAVYYYIKDVKQLLAIKQIYRGYILAEATRSGISLSTPILQVNQVNLNQAGSA